MIVTHGSTTLVLSKIVPSVVRQRRTARIRDGDFHSKPCSLSLRSVTTRGKPCECEGDDSLFKQDA